MDQFDRSPCACVSGTAPGVMLFLAPGWIGGPTSVKGPVGTFQDVTIERHAGIIFGRAWDWQESLKMIV